MEKILKLTLSILVDLRLSEGIEAKMMEEKETKGKRGRPRKGAVFTPIAELRKIRHNQLQRLRENCVKEVVELNHLISTFKENYTPRLDLSSSQIAQG